MFDFAVAEIPESAKTLRAQVRTFLDDEVAQGLWHRAGDFGTYFDGGFSQRLGAQGWLGLTWPKLYGGHEKTMLERLVVSEECLAAGAPVAAHWIADRQSGPQFLKFGTEEQRQRILPGIVRGEVFFAIGMSEPDAGSDLASVRSRAVKVSGGWQLNGRKVWTSFAHKANYAICLFRSSDRAEVKHAGLTQFLVPMNAKGLTIRPIINYTGTHEFNELTFENVFVPDQDLIGREGEGWRQVTSELAYERSGPERYLSTMQLLNKLALEANSIALPSKNLLQSLGGLLARFHALRQMSWSVAASLQAGKMPNLEAAIIKDLGNAYERDTLTEARRLLPEYSAQQQKALLELLQALEKVAPSWMFRGGTREVLRGMIAKALSHANVTASREAMASQMAPSGADPLIYEQALRFALSLNTQASVEQVFPQMSKAGYLPELERLAPKDERELQYSLLCAYGESDLPVLQSQVHPLVACLLICSRLKSALNLSLAYVQAREQFGSSLFDKQAVQHLLAQAVQYLAAARMACDTAWFAPAEQSALTDAAVSQVQWSTPRLFEILHHVHGAMSYTQDYGLHRFTLPALAWRDALGSDQAQSERLGAMMRDKGHFWDAALALTLKERTYS